MKPTSFRISQKVILTAFTCFAGNQSRAEVVTWNGTSSTTFSDGLNWDGNIPPADDLTSDIARFAGSLTANQPAITTNLSVSGLQFDSDGWTLGGGSTLKIGESGILANGSTTINALLEFKNTASGAPGLPGSISAAAGKTLNLGNIRRDSGTFADLQFNAGGNTGTVSIDGTSDNSFINATLLAGKIILNKGTLGGTANTGSSFSNLTINSGAIAEYGPNTTDRNDTGLRGRGQIHSLANVNGTLDLKGNGTFSDNWSIGILNGANTGLVTNTGTGAAQVRILDGGSFAGKLNDGTSTTALRVDLANGSNVLQLNNTANTYSGGTEILSGQLRLVSDGSLGTAPSSPAINITLNGADAILMNNNSSLRLNVNRTIEIGANGGTFRSGWANRSFTMDGVIMGDGKVTIASDSSAVVFNNANNTYSGGTDINGILRVTSDGSLGTVPSTVSTNIVMNSSNAQLMNFDSNPVIHANRTIRIDEAGGSFKAGWGKSLTIAGNVTGAGDVRISADSGTVFFNGLNTYTGNTILNSSKLTLSDGAQMLFQLGGNAVSNSISGTGSNTLNLSGDFVIDMALAAIADGNVWTLVDVGSVSTNPFSSTFSVVGFTEESDVWTMNSGDNNWTFRESNGQLSLMVVPEPSAALLGMLGALSMLRRRR